VPPGGSVTVDLKLFSDECTGPWTLSTEEWWTSGELTFAIDQPEGDNGDVRHLTITRAPGMPFENEYGVLIHSTKGAQTNTWWLAIGY
jgi:hypothetical protein